MRDAFFLLLFATGALLYTLDCKDQGFLFVCAACWWHVMSETQTKSKNE